MALLEKICHFKDEFELFVKEYILMDRTLFGSCIGVLEKIAQFIGYPFSLEDENKDVVHNIINLYSFENLS